MFRQKGDLRVHISILGEGERGVSPESRIQSLESRVQGSLQLLGCADPTVIVKSWKFAYWDAKKVLKNCQKSKKWISCYRKFCIFLFSI